MIAGSLPYGFLPTNDLSRSVLQIELPPGSTIADTEATSDRITALLKRRPEVRSVYAVGGASGANGLSITAGEVRKATIVIDLVAAQRPPSHDQKAFECDMRAALSAIPDMRYSFGNGGGGREFTLILSGPMAPRSSKRRSHRSGRPGRKCPFSRMSSRRPRLPGRKFASCRGLMRPPISASPRAQIAEAARIATVGDVSAHLAKFSAIDRQVPIRVQLDEAGSGRLIDPRYAAHQSQERHDAYHWRRSPTPASARERRP